MKLILLWQILVGDKVLSKKINGGGRRTFLCLKRLVVLGLKTFKDFNSALPSKQWWRIIHNEDLLNFKIIRGKYLPRVSSSSTGLTLNCSYLWRSLLAGKNLVDKGSFWHIGDGMRVRVWEDQWVRKEQYCKVTLPTGPLVPTHLKVEAFD